MYETRVRSRGDIGRVAASVWCMAVLLYVYICIYICMYLYYIYVGVGGNCAYMRLEYEAEGTSAAYCECVVYGGFDVYMYTYVYICTYSSICGR